MDLELYWDEAGDPRARSRKKNDLLASFLESDIQGSDTYAREILEAIDKVAAGDLDEWERTGNAHTLSLTRAWAEIQPEIDDEAPSRRLPLRDLREAVRRWLELLEDERTDD